MCGIVGFSANLETSALQSRVRRMLQPVRDRGPDAVGLWADDGIAIGHTRLAVVDLTAAGRQPMISQCGRYVLSFNGEIYNAGELRSHLDQATNIQWRGHSDTETLLEYIAFYGLAETLPKLNGMFALGLWDRSARSLSIARDRFGEKPLYYIQSDTSFGFASELSCFKAAGDIDLDLNRSALSEYFLYGYVPEDCSIYCNVSKLAPGSSLTWKSGAPGVPRPYWSAVEVFQRGLENRISDAGTAIEAINAALDRACRLRLASDVPLGLFLSGGIDSSILAALTQRASGQRLKTFSIGVDDIAFDEAPHAAAVAHYLGTDHHSEYVTSEELLKVIPTLGEFTDEPFADASLIPTYLVSKITSEHVTVVITGDGGDELFGGYPRYASVQKQWNWIRLLPARRALARTLSNVSEWGDDFQKHVECPKIASSIQFKLERISQKLRADSLMDLHENSIRSTAPPDLVLMDGDRRAGSTIPTNLGWLDPLGQLRYLDIVNYLPSDLLVKVDRASMRNSLEGRMPFLDPEVFELSCRLDSSLMMRGDVNKWVLREALYKIIPRRLVDRPKQGFSLPIDRWLRGPLRSWALDLLDRQSISDQGVLNVQAVEDAKHDYFVRGKSSQLMIWSLLAFQMWLKADKWEMKEPGDLAA
ncbi:asparagine synthase (glutamine-hydrolyzing) [Methylocystis sp. IM3]|uniref:asparagine synthase (glutamine-hydrolyzing) n=1 Tax=unclassified Methylocystis TaxID=2625913 RepID=UPI0031198C3E